MRSYPYMLLSMDSIYSYSYGHDDVYCYKDSEVLKNKFNITDQRELQELERNITSVKALSILESNGNNPDFSLLKKIHKELFCDIYVWAGKIRTVDISKGTLFCRTFAINDEAERIFNELKKENYLRNCLPNELYKRMSYYMAEINALHPFREGNGRTQRLFMAILAKHLGYVLDFSLISEAEMIEASYRSFSGDYKMMDDIFLKALKKRQ